MRNAFFAHRATRRQGVEVGRVRLKHKKHSLGQKPQAISTILKPTTMKNGQIVTDNVKGSFRHPIPLTDGAKQFIEGKVTVKMGKESATGDAVFKFTSSTIPMDDEEFETLVEAGTEALREYLGQFRNQLQEANNRIANGQLDMFAAVPGEETRVVTGNRAPRKKTAKSAEDGGVSFSL